MEFLYNGSILLVDLAAKSAEEAPFPDGFISTYLGGARANLALLDLCPGADLVLGSGPFTALPVPGGCLGVATRREEDGVTHTPLHLFAGMELKLSGFDFIVLSGTAPEPVYLWLHDGIADISPAQSLPADNWEAVDALRRELGEDLVQVVLGGAFPPSTAGNPRPFGMPPFATTLGDEEVAAVISYIRNAWGPQAGPVSPLEVQRWRGSVRP